MAPQQDPKQHVEQDRNSESTQSRMPDNTTVLVNGTDIFRVIDPTRYTAAVQKVLSHNLKMAMQDASYAALTTIPNISTDVEINPIFTILQRPLDFSFEWERRPWLNVTGGSPPLRIIPSVHLPLPELTVGAPTIAYWRFSYITKIQAALTRFGKTSMAQPLNQAHGIRDMATFTYMEPITSGSTPSIKFQPHENEIYTRGADNVQAVYSDMLLMQDRWGSSKYMVDLPEILGKLTVMWVFGHVEGFADGRLVADPLREKDLALAETLKLHAARSNCPRDTSASSPSTSDSSSKPPPKKNPWALYPVQRLVDINTGRILATYTRNAPLNKAAGTLTIFPKLTADQTDPYECLSGELIEGLIIVTAAMVDMQTRSGLMSGLWEAGAESVRWLEEPPHPLRSDP